MWVDNRSRHAPVLSKSRLDEALSLANISVELVYERTAAGLQPLETLPKRLETDPPDIRRRVLWTGVSVTATGTVRSREPVRAVQLHIGNATHSVLVFGRRWWRRGLRGVSATEPEAIGELALSWKHAYGGSVDLPAGYFPGTELPWPGGRLFYPLNPEGTGFYPTEDAAIDQPLPSIENPNARVAAPSDAPTPAGVAPCPDLHALKLMGTVEKVACEGLDGVRAQFRAALRAQHHAPAPLIVEGISPGTALSVTGLGGEPFGFAVPPPPVSVVFERSRRDRRTITPHLRSVHIDAEVGRVRAVWGHTHSYHPDRAPRRVDVEDRAA